MQLISGDNHCVEVLGEARSARGFEGLACLTPLRNTKKKEKGPVEHWQIDSWPQSLGLISQPFDTDIEPRSLCGYSEWFVSTCRTRERRGVQGLETPAVLARCSQTPGLMTLTALNKEGINYPNGRHHHYHLHYRRYRRGHHFVEWRDKEMWFLVLTMTIFGGVFFGK